jgi:adenosyl cobinamide kinase/adenosyl cobinamide phosphate guanylyltransferase
MVLSLGKATLYEMQTVYSVEDLHDIVEVAMVDAENSRRIAKHQRRRERDS